MPKIEANFYDFEPEIFPTLDLTLYSDEALREMAYFIWSIHADDVGLMIWRSQKLLPLVRIDELIDVDED